MLNSEIIFSNFFLLLQWLSKIKYMKTIGLLGGVSWHSTIEYYKNINKLVNKKLGGKNSAQCIIYSVNFNDITSNAYKGNFKAIEELITNACIKLEQSGADCIGLCANTIHRFAEEVTHKIAIPIIHIADETGKVLQKQNISMAGLLGTKLTMEDEFYCNKLRNYGVEPMIPDEEDRKYIHNVILEELTQGIFKTETEKRVLSIIDKLQKCGAGGVILGCTEIPLLISQSNSSIPFFDTTIIHSKALVDFALK